MQSEHSPPLRERFTLHHSSQGSTPRIEVRDGKLTIAAFGWSRKLDLSDSVTVEEESKIHGLLVTFDSHTKMPANFKFHNVRFICKNAQRVPKPDPNFFCRTSPTFNASPNITYSLDVCVLRVYYDRIIDLVPTQRFCYSKFSVCVRFEPCR